MGEKAACGGLGQNTRYAATRANPTSPAIKARFFLLGWPAGFSPTSLTTQSSWVELFESLARVESQGECPPMMPRNSGEDPTSGRTSSGESQTKKADERSDSLELNAPDATLSVGLRGSLQTRRRTPRSVRA